MLQRIKVHKLGMAETKHELNAVKELQGHKRKQQFLRP